MWHWFCMCLVYLFNTCICGVNVDVLMQRNNLLKNPTKKRCWTLVEVAADARLTSSTNQSTLAPLSLFCAVRPRAQLKPWWRLHIWLLTTSVVVLVGVMFLCIVWSHWKMEPLPWNSGTTLKWRWNWRKRPRCWKLCTRSPNWFVHRSFLHSCKVCSGLKFKLFCRALSINEPVLSSSV